MSPEFLGLMMILALSETAPRQPRRIHGLRTEGITLHMLTPEEKTEPVDSRIDQLATKPELLSDEGKKCSIVKGFFANGKRPLEVHSWDQIDMDTLPDGYDWRQLKDTD